MSRSTCAMGAFRTYWLRSLACAGMVVAGSVFLGPPMGVTQAQVKLEVVSQLGGPPTAVAARGQYLFAGVGQQFLVLDGSDWHSPRVVGQLKFDKPIASVRVAEDYAIVVAGYMRVVDITDLVNPHEVASIKPKGVLHPAIALDRDYAFFSEYTKIGIVDLLNYEDPRYWNISLFEAPDDRYDGVSVAGHLAFFMLTPGSHRSAFRIVDVSNPFAPRALGVFSVDGEAGAVAAEGKYAYLYVDDWANPDSRLYVVDVSDPNRPHLVTWVSLRSTEAPLSWQDWRGQVAVQNGYVYIVTGQLGLAAVDVRDPLRPRVAGEFTGSGSGIDLALAGDHAFVADGTSSVTVIDLEDPGLPTPVSSYRHPDSGRLSAIGLAGSLAYVLAQPVDDPSQWGLRVIDLSDPINPQLIHVEQVHEPSCDERWAAAWSHQIIVSDSYAYIAVGCLLAVADVSEPRNPRFVGSVAIPRDWAQMAVGHQFGVLVTDSRSLLVLDLARPEQPQQVASLELAYNLWSVVVSGSYALVTGDSERNATSGDSASMLLVVDLTDLREPKVTKQLTLDGRSGGLAAHGHFLYVLGSPYVHTFDWTVPSQPRELTRLKWTDVTLEATWAVTDEGYIYANNCFYGGCRLVVFDISTPTKPTVVLIYLPVFELASYWGPELRSVVPSHGYLYIADGRSGLFTLRISPPPPAPNRTGWTAYLPVAQKP